MFLGMSVNVILSTYEEFEIEIDVLVNLLRIFCLFSVFLFFFFFFFQAEDGIRDLYVTGVQTCALPICRVRLADCADDAAALLETLGTGPVIAVGYSLGGPVAQLLWKRHPDLVSGLRSEERRVGKECRVGWSPERGKKKSRKGRE